MPDCTCALRAPFTDPLCPVHGFPDGLEPEEAMDYTPIRPWPTEVTEEMVDRAFAAHPAATTRSGIRIALEAALLERGEDCG